MTTREEFNESLTGLYHSSSLTLNITRTQYELENALYAALRQCWTVPEYQTTSVYMAVLFISIGRMPFSGTIS